MQGLPLFLRDTFKSLGPLVPRPLTSLQQPTQCHRLRPYRSLLQGKNLQGRGSCYLPAPSPNVQCTLAPAFLRVATMVSRQFWSLSASVAPAPSNPVLNADPQLTLSLNNTAFSHLQNGCCKSLCLLPLTLGWKKSEQKVLIPILMCQKCLTNRGFCCCPADGRISRCHLRAPASVPAGKSRTVLRGQAWRDAQ